jgi:hypothetical protein
MLFSLVVFLALFLLRFWALGLSFRRVVDRGVSSEIWPWKLGVGEEASSPVRGDLAGDEVWVGLGRGGKGLGWGGIKFAGVWANAGYCGWTLEMGVGVGMTPGTVCSWFLI